MAIKTGRQRMKQDVRKTQTSLENNAFDTMTGIDPDMHVTGGAITSSEYEQNMTPAEQRKYENLLLTRFKSAFGRDPYRQNLDFMHWLKTLNPDLYRERAKRYDDIKYANNGRLAFRNMDPEKQALLEDAGLLQDLAHLHTGRIEDLVEIVNSLDPGMTPSTANMPYDQAPNLQEMPIRR